MDGGKDRSMDGWIHGGMHCSLDMQNWRLGRGLTKNEGGEGSLKTA